MKLILQSFYLIIIIFCLLLSFMISSGCKKEEPNFDQLIVYLRNNLEERHNIDVLIEESYRQKWWGALGSLYVISLDVSYKDCKTFINIRWYHDTNQIENIFNKGKYIRMSRENFSNCYYYNDESGAKYCHIKSYLYMIGPNSCSSFKGEKLQEKLNIALVNSIMITYKEEKSK